MTLSPLDLVLSKFPDAKPAGTNKEGHDEWKACCPAHDDKKASLSIGTGSDGRVLLRCHTSACTNADIVRAVGLTLEDLFPPKDKAAPDEKWVMVPGSMRPTAYDYTDAQGIVLYQAVRKQFTERNEATGKRAQRKRFFSSARPRRVKRAKTALCPV